MKKLRCDMVSTLLVAVLLSACGDISNTTDGLYKPHISQTESAYDSQSDLAQNIDEGEEMLKIEIGDITLHATLEDNSSVDALRDLLADGEITVDVYNYGGFEKVGTLPQNLPQNDVQTTAMPGDIMLYQGKSIVIFYGSNSWAYTKLGTITGLNREELSKILSGNDSTIRLSI